MGLYPYAHTIYSNYMYFNMYINMHAFMSVGSDVKWCPVSKITTPLACKRPFHWISMKSRLVRAARET